MQYYMNIHLVIINNRLAIVVCLNDTSLQGAKNRQLKKSIAIIKQDFSLAGWFVTFFSVHILTLVKIPMAQSLINFPLTTMLCVLILSLITLCFASDNNSSSSNPRDNKVSRLLFRVSITREGSQAHNRSRQWLSTLKTHKNPNSLKCRLEAITTSRNNRSRYRNII